MRIQALSTRILPIPRLNDFCTLEGVTQRGVCLYLDKNWKDPSQEQLTQLKESLEALEVSQKNTLRSNKALFEEAKQILLQELQATGVLLRTKNGSLRKEHQKTVDALENTFNASYIKNANARIDFCYLEGKEISITRNPQGIVDGIQKFCNYKKHKEQQELKENKIYLKAVNLATKYNIDPASYTDSNKLIYDVTQKAQEEWRVEHHPDGSEMSFDACECRRWSVGERRCDCGDRRVYLDIEGDLLSGFFAYPQAN